MANEKIMTDARRIAVMAKLEKRREVIASQVVSVAKGYTTAMFLHGPGGLGKTHIVTSQLDALCGKRWAHHTAFTTPKALLMSLAEEPEIVHCFEDCEKMYKQEVSASILRAACGAPKGNARWVTYETANERFKINFKGGVIIVSNEDLAKAKGPLNAVASRFRPVKWDMSVEERIASILTIAEEGWERGVHYLDKTQCRRVAHFLVEEMVSGQMDRPVDLRTFVEHALPIYAQFVTEASGPNWKDVLRSKLAGQIQPEEKREDKTARLENTALAIYENAAFDDGASKIKAWKEATGLAQAIYYRHLKNARKRSNAGQRNSIEPVGQ